MSSAASLVGSDIQGLAALLDQWAMEQTYKNAMAQQAQYQQQATGVFNKNLPSFGSGAAAGDLSAATGNRMAQYDTANSIPINVTKGNVTGYSPAAQKSMNATFAAPRAALGAYGDWQHQLGTTSTQEARDLGQISNFAGGTASVLPYQMYDAQNKYDWLSQLGAAISSIGGGSGMSVQGFGGSPPTSPNPGMPAYQPANVGYDYPSPTTYDPNAAAYVVG